MDRTECSLCNDSQVHEGKPSIYAHQANRVSPFNWVFSDQPCEPILLPCSLAFCSTCRDALQILAKCQHQCPAVKKKRSTPTPTFLLPQNCSTPINGGEDKNESDDNLSRSLETGRQSVKADSKEEEENDDDDDESLLVPSMSSLSLTSESGSPVFSLPVWTPNLKDPVGVYVSHIMSQDHFYVQLKDDNVNLQKIANKLKKLGAARSVEPLSRPPQVGEFLMAQFSEDLQWYRGRVVSLISDDKMADIVYVDYGNTELVPYSKLKPMKKCLTETKAIAVECKLDKVNPKSESQWKTQGKAFFKRILEGL